jgi:putative addiction module killer protein
MYFIKQDEVIVVMLGGGNKSSQVADIEAAKRLARKLKGIES